MSPPICGADGITASLDVCGPEERLLSAGVVPPTTGSFRLGLRDLGLSCPSWLLPLSCEFGFAKFPTGTGCCPAIARVSFSSRCRNVAPLPSNRARSLEFRPNHFTSLGACPRFCSNVKDRKNVCAGAGAAANSVVPVKVSEHSRSRSGLRTNTGSERARSTVAIGNWNSLMADLSSTMKSKIRLKRRQPNDLIWRICAPDGWRNPETNSSFRDDKMESQYRTMPHEEKDPPTSWTETKPERRTFGVHYTVPLPAAVCRLDWRFLNRDRGFSKGRESRDSKQMVCPVPPSGSYTV
jgi:hypothetical protein